MTARTADSAVVSIRLTRLQHAELKRLAADEHRTISQQIRHLVDAAIAQPREAA